MRNSSLLYLAITALFFAACSGNKAKDEARAFSYTKIDVEENGNGRFKISDEGLVSSIGNKIQAYNNEGKLLFEINDSTLDIADDAEGFIDGMLALSNGSKKGFYSIEGKKVIDHRFTTVTPFNNGFASVEENGKWIIIDKTGNTAAATDYLLILPFYQHQAIAKDKTGYVLIDEKGGVLKQLPWLGWIGENKKYEIHSGRFIDHNLLVLIPMVGYGVVNEEGKEVIPCIYNFAQDESDGSGYLMCGEEDSCFYFTGTGERLFKDLNLEGNTQIVKGVFPYAIGDEISAHWVIANTKGETLADLESKDIYGISEIRNDLAFALTNFNSSFEPAAYRYGIINTKGDVLVKDAFQKYWENNGFLAAVDDSTGNLMFIHYGYVN